MLLHLFFFVVIMKVKGKEIMQKILECQNLCKSFGKKQILKDVSFEIDEGDILAFIGPNGSGKTTTIKLILGLQNIDSGSVKINGYDVEKDFVKSIEKVGAIVENPDTYMYLSGWQNLKLVANLYKGVTDDDLKRYLASLYDLNLSRSSIASYIRNPRNISPSTSPNTTFNLINILLKMFSNYSSNILPNHLTKRTFKIFLLTSYT